ncbi:putative UDP-N-acetylglucosamine-peptide N-acetylglucosaminyltransferase SPINDLY-like protein [Trifolium pratense]|uniref:Putative UDP-N-acetylglucosamine-peptide N-acetylglucosaminyltransferase SPINDLY-like protein n=1 Tax=Trifolium pratense TaxID=57577 RepID=A0A2K3MWG0_TRIPR|nr:putative UDP-N-acetylglucosamine-peptide N-acetylglucosaminyltransferase SPINDLY-like protein [Trifolium pratense]
MVREDQSDILVELTGHNANNTLGMMACRPAPGVAYEKAFYYNWHYADAMYNLGVAYDEMLKVDRYLDNLDKATECY